MRSIASIRVVALLVLMHLIPSGSIPPELIGTWRIGRGYDTPNVVGINAAQERFIRKFPLVYSPGHLHVCGKDVVIRAVEQKSLTVDEFLQAYGFLPRFAGLGQATVVNLTINPTRWGASDSFGACGDYEDPGTEVLIGSNGHIVIEVAGEYLPLIKKK